MYDENECPMTSAEESDLPEESPVTELTDESPELDPFANAFQYDEAPQKKPATWPVVVLTVLLVAVLAGGLLWAFSPSEPGSDNGITSTMAVPFGTNDLSELTAATAGDLTLHNGVLAFRMESAYRYYLNNYYSYYGAYPTDVTRPLKEQNTELYTYLVEDTKSELESLLLLNRSAAEHGITLNQAALWYVNQAVATVDPDQYHNGVSIDDARAYYTLYYTALLEESSLYGHVLLDDQQIQDFYNEFSEYYHTCDAAMFRFTVGEDGDYATVDEATAAANALAACTTPDAFKAAVTAHLVNNGFCDTQAEAEETYDTSCIATGLEYSDEDEALLWLFDDNTAVGDTKIVTQEGYVAVYMLTKAKTRDTAAVARTRSILFGKDVHGSLEAAKAKAEEVLAALQAEGTITLDAFQSAARQYTADFTTYDGSAWYHSEDETVDETVATWLFDSTRIAGDVALFSTDQGWQLLFFENIKEGWYAEVFTEAQYDLVETLMEQMAEEDPVTFDDTVISQNEI